MYPTSHPNGTSTTAQAPAPKGDSTAAHDRHPSRYPAPRLIVLTAVLAAFLATLTVGCSPATHRSRCVPGSEALPASRAASLIAVIPRTSAEAATWGLRELTLLLPYLAQAGLDLHVFYTQDGDDLTEDGGDGGPPQVLETQAPSFPVFDVGDAPPAPSDPSTLTAELYCGHLAAWQSSATAAVKAEVARRASAVSAWAKSTAARLIAIASRPIPDTEGPEADVEFDAGASIFSAAQVALTAPRPTILFLGGLTEVSPPSQSFAVPTRVVALVRSTDPAQVLHAESSWSRWVTKAGGTFRAVSAYDSPAVIASALAS